MALTKIDDRGLKTPIDLLDNEKIRIGNSNDLQIVHESHISKIIDDKGDLRIMGDTIRIQRNAGGENFIYATEGGTTRLHYDGTTKFETTSAGATVSGNLLLSTTGSTQISLLDSDNGFSASTVGVSNGGRDLTIQAPQDIRLKPADGEDGIVILNNGAVELYYDNVKKFDTISSGVQIYGDLQLQGGDGDTQSLYWDKSDYILKFKDNIHAEWGNSRDLKIYHNGTASDSYIDNDTGNLFLRNDTTGGGIYLRVNQTEAAIAANKNGSVELYYDDSKKFETVSTGCEVFGSLGIARTAGGYTFREVAGGGERAGIHSNSSNEIVIKAAGAVEVARFTSVNFRMNDNKKIQLGNSHDLQIYHDGSHSYIDETGTGNLMIKASILKINNPANSEAFIHAYENGGVELYYDGSKKFDTWTNGVKVNRILELDGSTPRLRFKPTADTQVPRIEFYNTATNIKSRIVGQTDGEVRIETGTNGTEDAVVCKPNAAVELYHNNNKKLETTSGGVDVTGAITVNGSPLSSAPTVELTASGAIGANKPVIVNSSGQAEEISIPADSAGSGAEATTASIGGVRVFGNGAGQYILAWISGSTIKGYVATISGTTVSYGTAVNLESSAAGGYRDFDICYIPGKDCYGLGFDASDGVSARTFKVSGTTITVSSRNHINSNNENSISVAAVTKSGDPGYSDGVFTLFHYDQTYGRTFLRGLKVNGDGSSGSPQGTSSSWWSYSSVNRARCAYHEGESRFYAIYRRSGDLKAVTWDVGSDGTSMSRDNNGITLVSSVGDSGSDDGLDNSVVYEPTSGKLIISYTKDSNKQAFMRTIAYASSSSYTLGSELSLGNNRQFVYLAEYNDKIYATYTDSSGDNGSGDLQIRDISISGTTLTAGTETEISSDNHRRGSCVGGNAGIFIGYRNQDSSSRPTGYFFKVGITNLTTENFVGFADAAISNGASGTINVTGNTTTQSSLTAGQKYYLQGNGTLSTTAGSPSVEAGVALSSTKLLIKG